MSNIVIQIQGGLVQDVFLYGTGEVIGYITVDEDCSGSDPNKIIAVKLTGNEIYEAECGGPAGCIKIAKNRYLFFGWASS